MSGKAPGRLSERLASRCNADGEFRLTARYWDGLLRIDTEAWALDFIIEAGVIAPWPAASGRDYIGLRGPSAAWQKVLAPVPPPGFNDINPAMAAGIVRDGNEELWWQYYPAIRRLIDLLREEVNANAAV